MSFTASSSPFTLLVYVWAMPMLMQPRPIADTSGPRRPSFRYCMAKLLVGFHQDPRVYRRSVSVEAWRSVMEIRVEHAYFGDLIHRQPVRLGDRADRRRV